MWDPVTTSQRWRCVTHATVAFGYVIASAYFVASFYSFQLLLQRRDSLQELQHWRWRDLFWYNTSHRGNNTYRLGSWHRESSDLDRNQRSRSSYRFLFYPLISRAIARGWLTRTRWYGNDLLLDQPVTSSRGMLLCCILPRNLNQSLRCPRSDADRVFLCAVRAFTLSAFQRYPRLPLRCPHLAVDL